MNGDLILLLCASIVAAILGLLEAFRSRWENVTAAGLAILGGALAVWILV